MITRTLGQMLEWTSEKEIHTGYWQKYFMIRNLKKGNCLVLGLGFDGFFFIWVIDENKAYKNLKYLGFFPDTFLVSHLLKGQEEKGAKK